MTPAEPIFFPNQHAPSRCSAVKNCSDPYIEHSPSNTSMHTCTHARTLCFCIHPTFFSFYYTNCLKVYLCCYKKIILHWAIWEPQKVISHSFRGWEVRIKVPTMWYMVRSCSVLLSQCVPSGSVPVSEGPKWTNATP